ncbi:hypothetical protein CC86DRAFT_471493 [Ophiobolus disseminans]|uniref:Uncharacterized protein n=1 Tax=Ophiobolus disseminans TaxID=1469910 RepID=A0A6A6ZHR4_9PLEO|nr:hypothetical protein CC86DRAFT_471493 [Ophiobolus disseminans]
MYIDGYKQFKDRVYQIASEDGNLNIIIHPQLMPEVRKLPDTVLSFPEAVDMMMESKYTGYSSEAALMIHSFRADPNPALSRLNPIILAVSDQAIAEQMPDCNDWTPVHVYSKPSKMVAKISGRLFVGPDLCNDPIYPESSIAYTFDVIGAQHAIKHVRPILKPFLFEHPDPLYLVEEYDGGPVSLRHQMSDQNNELDDPSDIFAIDDDIAARTGFNHASQPGIQLF